MARQFDDESVRFGLQELCQRLNLPYREARYLSEKDWLPADVARDPGRGNHRRLSPPQAVWLGLVLKLKACGVRAETAARVAAFAERVKGLSHTLGWDWPFSPFEGVLTTEHLWFVEVGDLRFFRVVTDANPGKPGLDATPWVDMDTDQPAEGAAPIVTLRVDLSALARLLRGPSA